MGIRIHELAKQLGLQSKQLVALCQALKASGKLTKEVRTASSSLEAEDEAVVRREHASGAHGVPDAGEKPSQEAAPAQSAGPIRLMQSVASKPKGHSPTQLARPEKPAPKARPKPPEEPTPAPPPEEPPEAETPAPAEEPPQAEAKEDESAPSPPPEERPPAKVRVPSLPGAEPPPEEPKEPPAAKVKIAALPGFEKPEEPPPPEPAAEPAEEPEAPVAEAAPEEPEPKAAEPAAAAPPEPKAEAPKPEKKAKPAPKVKVPALPKATPEPPEPKAKPAPPAPKPPPSPAATQPPPAAVPPAREPKPAPPAQPSLPPLTDRKVAPPAEPKAKAPRVDTTARPPRSRPKPPSGPRTSESPPSRPAPSSRTPSDSGRRTQPRRSRDGRAPVPRPRRQGLRPIPKPSAMRPRPVRKDTKVVLQPPIVVKELSQEMGVKAGDIIRKLMENNILATINQVIDPETASTICLDFGFEVEIKKAKDAEEDLQKLVSEEEDRPEDVLPRAPIVTLLGHVDHGKTSLLDSIRRTNVAEGESGGITQHIGAYQVKAGERSVTFLDTPGHEAFTSMRARGANCTDVVVLVIAADDGIMPQTEEAINHARAANVPMVVALNKIDRPNANPMRAKQQLAALELNPEEWGGDTVVVEVSAITGQGVNDLLEMLALESELLDLKANPNKSAQGVVLEAELSAGRGAEATLLVREGTLNAGDVILCGQGYGRVRAMLNDKGGRVKKAGPATPVVVSGLSTVPQAGDKFFCVKDLQTAKDVAEDRERRARMAALVERKHVTLDNLFEHIESGEVKEVCVVLKADVQGSVEVLQNSLNDLGTEEVKVRVLHKGVGGITESDVLLADASDAVVIGFHVTPEERARSLADEKGVDLRLYQVIYNAIDDMRKAMEGLLDPEQREEIQGHAEVRRVFRVSRMGSIAGCSVRDGTINRSSLLRLTRDNVVIYSGRLQSLRIVKDDVREVRAGQECGIKIEGYDDIKEGDVIEAYVVHEVSRTIET